MPGETRSAELVIPLAPLSFFGLSASLTDLVRLRFSLETPETGEDPVLSDWLLLRFGALPALSPRQRAGEELFARFGARIVTLGADWDGHFLTGWFLLENNNDFPLRLDRGEDGEGALCGGSVQAHSSAVFRADLPVGLKYAWFSFTLDCALSAYADGEEKPAVPMAWIKAPLRIEETAANEWAMTLTDTVETANDQSYVTRVGLRDFRYDACTPGFMQTRELSALPERESDAVSLVCCGGYEVLAGEELYTERGLELPLILRSYTGQALALSLAPNGRALSLPCLTAESLRAEANGSARLDYVFDIGGLAYTEYAGERTVEHGFTLLICPADEPERFSARHAVMRETRAAAGVEPLEPFAAEDVELGNFSARMLGLDLSNGLSLWLRVRNEGETDRSFGEAILPAMLNGSSVSLCNSGTLIPAHTETLVLLRGAATDGNAPDPFAFRLPPLSELNTLKLPLPAAEQTRTLSVMFQPNGNVMFASVV